MIRKKTIARRIWAAALAFATLVSGPVPLAGAANGAGSTAIASAPAVEQAVTFADLDNSYAKNAVNRLASLHLINGIGQNRFYPQKPISRQDVAVLLGKVVGMQPKAVHEAVFEDVPADSPYAPYIYGLAELGVMNGINDSMVGAAEPLTRQDMAVLLARLMKAAGVTKAASQTAVEYADEQDMAAYAKEAIAFVSDQRWMQGASGKFNPLGTVTRGEAAVIAARVLDERFQQAEKTEFAVDATRLTLLAGTSQRLNVTRPNGEKLPFTPIFSLDRPELGAVLPDGTFVAGPTAGKGNVTITLGYRTLTIPVEIKDAAEVPDAPADGVIPAGSADGAQDAASRAAGASEDGTNTDAGPPKDKQSAAEPAASDDVSENLAEQAKQADLVNVAPGSFTSVQTFGPPDSYFSELEKKYPGPVGGLVAPSEEWTGYARQFGRKVTVALSQTEPLERVTLTFKQQKTSGILLPESMDVEVSQDGKAWSYAGKVLHDVPASEDQVVQRTLSVSLPHVEARYVRVSFPVKVFVFARELQVWAKRGGLGEGGIVLLPPPSPVQAMEDKQAGHRVENMLLAYSGAYGERGTWTKEDFLPMVGYLTKDGYMRDQMFDTILFLPYPNLPATKDGWTGYMNDLFGAGKQLDALNSAMREYNRLRGTLYTTPVQENVVLTLPYPPVAQTDFGKLPDGKASLSFNAAQIGEEQAYENRKKALEWYFQELLKRWNKSGYSYLKLEGIYWYHELIDDNAPKERELIRSTASMVHNESLRFYWIPYFGAQGVAEWKDLFFDYAFLQPNYYSDKPVKLDRIEGVLDVVSKYGMGVEIEGDERMYRDPKFYQIYYNQLVAAHNLGMDTNKVHAYYYGSKTLVEASKSDDPVVRGIYDDTYKWMKGKFDRKEYYEADEMP